MIQSILDTIYKTHPTQEKKIEEYFRESPDAKQDLANFLEMYKPFMDKEAITDVQLADAYSEMVSQMMYCRVQFLRSGEYLSTDQQEAFENVYNDKATMSQYMFGAALSQFLWKSHHKLLNFYKEHIDAAPKSGNFLEVGCGHGLYVNYVLQHLDQNGTIDVVDISDTSIHLAKNIMATVNPDNADRVNFIKSDVNLFRTDTKYDFIGMGEVLEHVDDPLSVLRVLRNLMSDDARFFMTTCANCPTIDHVYLFNDVKEIRALIREAGLEIETDIVLPSENKPQDYLEKHKVDISYGAILKKG
ncbi:MAG: class I SAM-dependent methyltransferase [Alphaproteobacteria bacterium]